MQSQWSTDSPRTPALSHRYHRFVITKRSSGKSGLLAAVSGLAPGHGIGGRDIQALSLIERADVLLLEEFTPKPDERETLSASCRLTKRVSGGRIICDAAYGRTRTAVVVFPQAVSQLSLMNGLAEEGRDK